MTSLRHSRPTCPQCLTRFRVPRVTSFTFIQCKKCLEKFAYWPAGSAPTRCCIYCERLFTPKHKNHWMCGALKCRRKQKALIQYRWVHKEYG